MEGKERKVKETEKGRKGKLVLSTMLWLWPAKLNPASTQQLSRVSTLLLPYILLITRGSLKLKCTEGWGLEEIQTKLPFSDKWKFKHNCFLGFDQVIFSILHTCRYKEDSILFILLSLFEMSALRGWYSRKAYWLYNLLKYPVSFLTWCGSQNNVPSSPNVHFLIPGTCEYVILHCKGILLMWSIWRWGDYPELSGWTYIITKGLISRRSESGRRFDHRSRWWAGEVEGERERKKSEDAVLLLTLKWRNGHEPKNAGGI